jgi:hypothetical protein
VGYAGGVTVEARAIADNPDKSTQGIAGEISVDGPKRSQSQVRKISPPGGQRIDRPMKKAKKVAGAGEDLGVAPNTGVMDGAAMPSAHAPASHFARPP